jgi:hypothetical protein
MCIPFRYRSGPRSIPVVTRCCPRVVVLVLLFQRDGARSVLSYGDTVFYWPLFTRTPLIPRSNTYMKVQLAKLKADQEKSGKKSEHKVRCATTKRVGRMMADGATGELQEGRSDVGYCVSVLAP